jgi:hypothetical protein
MQQKERAEDRMGPPKDRLAAMQANAYFDDDDSFNIPVDEEQEGKHKMSFVFKGGPSMRYSSPSFLRTSSL